MSNLWDLSHIQPAGTDVLARAVEQPAADVAPARDLPAAVIAEIMNGACGKETVANHQEKRGRPCTS